MHLLKLLFLFQENQTRDVNVNGTPTKVKDLWLKDPSVENVKLTLWRGFCEEDVKVGDHVEVKDVVTNHRDNATSFNTTARTKIQVHLFLTFTGQSPLKPSH